MKLLLFILGICIGIGGIEKPAKAQNYPWCAQYSDGSMNCGFATFLQCLTDVSGIGGFCTQNKVPRPRARRTRPSLR